MKVVIWILAVLLVLGFATSLISPSITPGYKEPSGNDSSGGNEEPPSDSEEDEAVEYEVLWSGAPDFTSTIYEPNLAQVPSFYFYSEDFELGSASTLFTSDKNVFSYSFDGSSSSYSDHLFGENQFHFNLPNYSSGTYVYTLEVLTDGRVPSHMDVYLKSPGYLNQVNLLDIDSNIYNMGLNFTEGQISKFLLDFVFDFDNDIVEVYVTDLNGQKVLLTRNTIDWLRSYTVASTGEIANTKELPIIIRFQIPKGQYYADSASHIIAFNSYSYKKQINT